MTTKEQLEATIRPSLTEQQACTILDRLTEKGFRSGFDCAVVCLDGYYGQRSRRWGQPKSQRYGVSLTTIGEMRDAACDALGDGFADAGRGADGSYWIFEWKPQFDLLINGICDA